MRTVQADRCLKHVTAITGVCVTAKAIADGCFELGICGFGESGEYEGLPLTMKLEPKEVGLSLLDVLHGATFTPEINDCFETACIILVLNEELLIPLEGRLAGMKEKIVLFSSIFGIPPQEFVYAAGEDSIYKVYMYNVSDLTSAVSSHLERSLIDPEIFGPWMQHIKSLLGKSKPEQVGQNQAGTSKQ